MITDYQAVEAMINTSQRLGLDVWMFFGRSAQLCNPNQFYILIGWDNRVFISNDVARRVYAQNNVKISPSTADRCRSMELSP